MELWRSSNPPDLFCFNDLYQNTSTFKYFGNHRIWFCDYDITADALLFPGLSPKTPKWQLHGWFSAQKDVLLMRGSLKWASNSQNSKIAFYGLGSASACNYTRISSHISDTSLLKLRSILCFPKNKIQNMWPIVLLLLKRMPPQPRSKSGSGSCILQNRSILWSGHISRPWKTNNDTPDESLPFFKTQTLDFTSL